MKYKKKYYEISTSYKCVQKLSMTFVRNIWMICLELNWFVYDPSWMLQLSDFVWRLRSSVWIVFNYFIFRKYIYSWTIKINPYWFAVNLTHGAEKSLFQCYIKFQIKGFKFRLFLMPLDNMFSLIIRTDKIFR